MTERWLPRTWRGDGRQARWRRSRARRLLAGILGACAVLAVVGAVRPSAPATHAVTVAAHDLPAGAHLHADDLRQVSWSSKDKIPGLLAHRSAAGKVLIAPIRGGEPITSARVRSPRSWPAVPRGRVVIAVAGVDAGIVRVLQAGDRVDLIDTAKSGIMAYAVPVVAVTSPGGSDSAAARDAKQWGGSQGPAVLVAVTPQEAAAVGSAAAARSGGLGGGIQLALRTDA